MNEHSPILAQTVRVELAEGGLIRAIIFDTDRDTLALSVLTIAEGRTPEEVADWITSGPQAPHWSDLGHDIHVLGAVVREGKAARPGEVQHGRQVILVPEVLELTWAELIGSLLHESAPAEDREMARDPEPQTDLQDVWRWLREGLMKPLAGTDLHEAFLGASDAALYLQDGETGELVIADCSPEEGLDIQVYRGDLSWDLPTSGGKAVLL